MPTFIAGASRFGTTLSIAPTGPGIGPFPAAANAPRVSSTSRRDVGISNRSGTWVTGVPEPFPPGLFPSPRFLSVMMLSLFLSLRRWMQRFGRPLILAAALVLTACDPGDQGLSPAATTPPKSSSPSSLPAAASPRISVEFQDGIQRSGVDFMHVNGAFGKKW